MDWSEHWDYLIPVLAWKWHWHRGCLQTGLWRDRIVGSYVPFVWLWHQFNLWESSYFWTFSQALWCFVEIVEAAFEKRTQLLFSLYIYSCLVRQTNLKCDQGFWVGQQVSSGIAIVYDLPIIFLSRGSGSSSPKGMAKFWVSNRVRLVLGEEKEEHKLNDIQRHQILQKVGPNTFLLYVLLY